MANVVKKYTISSELAQKMVNEAMANSEPLPSQLWSPFWWQLGVSSL